MKKTPKACKFCKRSTTNDNQFCDEHQDKVPKRHEVYDRNRESPSKRGYDHTWRKFREVFLGENPFCEQCRAEGRLHPAWEVHHIKALRNGGARLDPENCMPLCKSCHSKITIQEMREECK